MPNQDNLVQRISLIMNGYSDGIAKNLMREAVNRIEELELKVKTLENSLADMLDVVEKYEMER